jgi:hypothetical protein
LKLEVDRKHPAGRTGGAPGPRPVRYVGTVGNWPAAATVKRGQKWVAINGRRHPDAMAVVEPCPG